MIYHLLLAYSAVVILMMIVWMVYKILNNPSVVDVSWSIGITLAAIIFLSSSPLDLRVFLIGTLLIIWCFRLAGYLWYTRVRKGIVDKRYIDLSRDWRFSPSVGYFLNFQLQGFLMILLALPFLFIAGQPFSWLDVIAGTCVVAGLIGETTADAQLHAFIQQKSGKVCDIGLWRFSRHPNYFCEWLIWVGFALFGYHHALGCIGLLSPLTLYFVMTRLTIPITERGSLASKGQLYKDYQSAVPMFFPLYRRRSAQH